MQEPENPVAARGTAPDPLLSYYYHYYYDKHTPLGWGSPLRAWLHNRSLFRLLARGLIGPQPTEVSAPHVRLLQGGLGSPLRAMLLFFTSEGVSESKTVGSVLPVAGPTPPCPAAPTFSEGVTQP
jgi:hypothetical protein